MGGEERGDHPATFPVEVEERCIKLAGIKPGMKVLDPFCGVTGMEAASERTTEASSCCRQRVRVGWRSFTPMVQSSPETSAMVSASLSLSTDGDPPPSIAKITPEFKYRTTRHKWSGPLSDRS